jgi:hypothetical protein
VSAAAWEGVGDDGRSPCCGVDVTGGGGALVVAPVMTHLATAFVGVLGVGDGVGRSLGRSHGRGRERQIICKNNGIERHVLSILGFSGMLLKTQT